VGRPDPNSDFQIRIFRSFPQVLEPKKALFVCKGFFHDKATYSAAKIELIYLQFSKKDHLKYRVTLL
jgi:hypothetical protein